MLLFFVRPPLLRDCGAASDPTRRNVDALLGLAGTVVSTFVDGTRSGEARQRRDLDRPPRRRLEEHALTEGEKVVVTPIDGATAVVVPAND